MLQSLRRRLRRSRLNNYMCFSYNYVDWVKGQIMSFRMNSMKNSMPRLIVAMCMFLTVLYCSELSSLVNQNEPMSRDMSE